MTDGRIEIIGWDRFQHYKDRNPPWIKNYTELLADDGYLGLSGNRRAILHGLWLAYAMSHGRLADNSLSLSRRLSVKVTRRDLEALSHAGFIRLVASTPLANRSTDASAHALARGRGREETQDQEQDQNPATATASLNAPRANGSTPHPDHIGAAVDESLAAAMQAGTTSHQLHEPEEEDIPL